LKKGTHGADENQIIETETEFRREPETHFEKHESGEQSAEQELEHDETETRLGQIESEIGLPRHALEILPLEILRAERK
jgi:hypothetical protein